MIQNGGLSDLIPIALWGGVITVVVSLFFLIAVIYLRLRQIRRQADLERIEEQWVPQLEQVAEGNLLVFDTDALDPSNLFHFLRLWTETYDDAPAEYQNRLVTLLEKNVTMDRIVKFLNNQGFDGALLAINVMGNWGKEEFWDDIEPYVESENPVLAMSALSSLGKIDAGRVLPMLIDQLMEREDLPRAQVFNVLSLASRETMTEEMIPRLNRATVEEQLRLLPYLTRCTDRAALTWAREQLGEVDHPEVVSQLLQVYEHMGTEQNEPDVLPFLDHEEWFVRVRAIQALDAMGSSNETKQGLIECLSDQQWWVRLRAAEALSDFPGTSRQELREIASEQEDPYAHDIIHHVLSVQGTTA